ncbi:hypothetical protein DRN52_07850, partial [Thermococci archaeon]
SKTNTTAILIIALILASNLYFIPKFIQVTSLYENHELDRLAKDIMRYDESRDAIIFSNSYIYVRPFITNKHTLSRLLPPPDTEQEFLNILEEGSNGTIFAITDDIRTAWYENGNSYIKDYLHKKTQLIQLQRRPSEWGETAIFTLKKNHLQKEITTQVQSIKIYVNKTLSVNILLRINSTVAKNVIILISTNRYTKIYEISLNAGINDIEISYPYILDREYMIKYYGHLYWARIVVIDGDNIIHNGVYSPINLNLLYRIFALILIFALVFYVFLSVNLRGMVMRILVRDGR